MASERLIVIGAGAAGFFCAVNAARLHPGLSVTLVEKTSKLLSKVKVSGGGRCNVTHACFDIGEMVKNYPRGANFVKRSFHQFFTPDTVSWFAERGVELKTESDGRMFPVTNSSQTIIDCLVRELNSFGIELRLGFDVKNIHREQDEWWIETGNGKIEKTNYVCVACGGFPKTAMFDWLVQLGHSIEPPMPSLFTFNMPGNAITKLMGISMPEAVIRVTGTKLEQRGPVLITHWGLSGPAVLKLSAWGARELQAKNYSFSISINWLPEFNEVTLRERFQQYRFELASQRVVARNPLGIPQRLWEYFIDLSFVSRDIRWADLPAKDQNKLIKTLCASSFEVKGKTTFKEEFVTSGGISLSEVDPSTMMSKKCPSLYFAGEILDVDGVTGGFNFQHAWTSGFIAATHIASSPV